MKALLFFVNGALVYWVADYGYRDWQAWVFIIWFWLAAEQIEREAKIEVRDKLMPIIDNMQNKLRSWRNDVR